MKTVILRDGLAFRGELGYWGGEVIIYNAELVKGGLSIIRIAGDLTITVRHTAIAAIEEDQPCQSSTFAA